MSSRHSIFVLIFLVVAMLALGSVAPAQNKSPAKHRLAAQVYACPKCEMASTHAGKCSCGETLISVKGKTIYACADCKTESSKAGKCPKCGKAMEKSFVTYACDKCHYAATKAGKCPKCGTKLQRHVLPFMKT